MPFEALPGDSGVRRLIKAGARAAAGEIPWLAAHLPQRGVDDVWIVRIKSDIDRAGIPILVQHPGPGAAAVRAAKYSALIVRPERMSKRRNQDDIGVPARSMSLL